MPPPNGGEQLRQHATHQNGVLVEDRFMTDIGNVLLIGDGEKNMTFDSYPNFPPAEGAIEVLRLAVDKWGAENGFIISRVLLKSRKAILEGWLEYHNIFDETGLINDQYSGVDINEQHMLFVRSWEEKARPIWNRRITKMVDDEPEVHAHTEKMYRSELEKLGITLGGQKDLRLQQLGFQYTEFNGYEHNRGNNRVTRVDSWEQIGKLWGLLP